MLYFITFRLLDIKDCRMQDPFHWHDIETYCVEIWKLYDHWWYKRDYMTTRVFKLVQLSIYVEIFDYYGHWWKQIPSIYDHTDQRWWPNKCGLFYSIDLLVFPNYQKNCYEVFCLDKALTTKPKNERWSRFILTDNKW